MNESKYSFRAEGKMWKQIWSLEIIDYININYKLIYPASVVWWALF